jgi:hypothetical protein
VVDFLLILPYNNIQTYTKEKLMSAEKTIESLKKFCTESSGDLLGQTWHGNKATYHWNIGKYDAHGTLNGVVRKLAGIDASGTQIWVVAGSFKINAEGKILRFTGLVKRMQVVVEAGAVTPITIETSVTETI